MDAEDLATLVAAGETFTVEFKAGSVNDDAIAAAVVCLANGEGGNLFLGVEDDGRISGYNPRRPTTPDRLIAMIAGRTEPAVVCSAEFLEVDEREVAVIAVPQVDSVVATSDGRFLRRARGVDGSPQCLPMGPHEVFSQVTSIGPHDFTATPLSAVSLEDLATAELDRMRTLAGDGGDRSLARLADEDLLRALRLITASGELTLGAVLLFGTENSIARFAPTHEIGFQVLSDLEVRANHIGRAPLLRAMDETATRIAAYNPEEEAQIGLIRLGLPKFSETAVRELLANALVHRDYTALGSVNVQIDDQAMEVSSPGGFPRGVNTRNLLVVPPTPRNPLLADAFKRANLVERTGRGISRAFRSQLALGRPSPDYGRSTENQVVARLPAGPTDKDLAVYIAELDRSGQRLSLGELMALHEVRSESRISTRRAADLFQVSVDEARAKLNGLVERGLLEVRGAGKGRTYHLAASVYKRLGEPGGYVRTRGFDALQHEQMILSFVKAHGEITRRQTADLCQLSPDQAGRLLRRLRQEGRLKLIGDRRTARYVLP